MKIYGQLEGAALESLGTDPTAAVQGRVYYNTATSRFMLDNGTTKRALIRNDGNAVFGTDATAANNVRLHHAGAGLMQLVTGADTTAENALSSSLAQLGFRAANFAGLPAAGNTGRILFNTVGSCLQVDLGAAFAQLATVAGTETFTNKTLVAPVADVVSFTDQSSTPATPASGSTKLYTKSGQVYKLGSDGLETLVGSGSGSGAFNYLSNGDFEQGISTVQWAKATVASGIVTGLPTMTSTQGTSSLGLTVETTAPLRNTKSLRITAATAWAQGDGVALGPALTVQPEDAGKVLSFSLAYQVVSGSANLNFSGTIASQNLVLAVLDVTNGAWVPVPAGAYGINGTAGQVSCTFQTSVAVGQRYQAFLFNAGATTSGACAVLVDDVQVGPQNIAPDSRTLASKFALSTATAVGANAIIPFNSVLFDFAGGFVAGGQFKVPVSGVYEVTISGSLSTGSNTTLFVWKNGVSDTGVGLWTTAQTATGTTLVSCVAGDLLDARADLSVTVQNNARISVKRVGGPAASVGDARVVAMNSLGVPTTTGFNTTATLIKYPAATTDSHAAYNASTGLYTVPVSGWYNVSATTDVAGTFAINGYAAVFLYKNGSALVQGGAVAGGSQGSVPTSLQTLVFANAGDTFGIYLKTSATSASFVADGTLHYLSIQRASGPSVVAASESVNASYYCSTAFAASPTVPVNFDLREWDSHNAVTVSATAWRFTAPVSGTYLVTMTGQASVSTPVNFYKNGVNYKYMYNVNAGTISSGNAGTIKLQAGEFFDLRPFTSSTFSGNGTLSQVNSSNISITRTGN